MRSSFRALFLCFLFLVPIGMVKAQIKHVEPPNWWAGMNHSGLQIMIHGEDIANLKLEMSYPGVSILSIERTTNDNYIFLNLDLENDVKPGSFDIKLLKNNKVVDRYNYELSLRKENSANRDCFDNSDVMYLLMPDRFANGDPNNDIVKEMRETILDRNDITGKHGGDLQGVVDHLDYLSDMGFTAIWLNPFLENDMERTSYHGYSITDYYKTDPRYGSNELFAQLSEEAERKGIKLIMDMVFNHCGSLHWWMQDPPSEDWINFSDNYTQCNHRRTINQDPYASAIDSKLMSDGWFVRSMPDLNQRNPFMANYLIQNSIWWMEFGNLSGIRQDTYPYPDKDMMAEWNKRLIAEYPDINIVGEEWSYDPGLISYWQKGKVNQDGYQGFLPSLMDFPMQDALVKSLTEEEGWNKGWIKLYETIASDYEYPDPFNLVILTDNHDMPRFFMQLEMNEDLYKLGITYLLTTRGIPQIYYGSEILMTHTEGDHHGYIRKDFPGGWEGDRKNAFTGLGMEQNELEMQQFFKTLLNWRKGNPVIHSGKLIHFAPHQGVYVYGRYNEDSRVMVLLNKTDKNASLNTDRFKELIGSYMKGTDVITRKIYDLTGEINVPPLTGLVLELK
jgi:glycosidase